MRIAFEDVFSPAPLVKAELVELLRPYRLAPRSLSELERLFVSPMNMVVPP